MTLRYRKLEAGRPCISTTGSPSPSMRTNERMPAAVKKLPAAWCAAIRCSPVTLLLIGAVLRA